MYLRFRIHRLDEEARAPIGVFNEAYRLLEERALAEHETEAIEELLAWFKEHLPIPTRFKRASGDHRPNRAICWLKSSATEHVRQVRALTALLEIQGVLVEVVKTEEPGSIVYEDDYQVAAEPYDRTPT